MKLYQISHVTDTHNDNAVMGDELIFTHSICPLTGERREPARQPDDWSNVRRLTNMLFYAWDDDCRSEGTVYLGKVKSVAIEPDDSLHRNEVLALRNGYAEMVRALSEADDANRRAEEIIKAREEKLHRVMDALKDAISTYDTERDTIVTAERQEAWIDALSS